MKIEYTVSGNLIKEGLDWKCYSRSTFKDALVFNELESVISCCGEESFENMKEIIRDRYKNRQSKSKASIYYDGDSIDIAKYNKCLPHIWIVKN